MTTKTFTTTAAPGEASDSFSLTVGSVRVRIVYRVPVSLADAA